MGDRTLAEILRELAANDPDGMPWPPTELERQAFAEIVNSYGPTVAELYWNGGW